MLEANGTPKLMLDSGQSDGADGAIIGTAPRWPGLLVFLVVLHLGRLLLSRLHLGRLLSISAASFSVASFSTTSFLAASYSVASFLIASFSVVSFLMKGTSLAIKDSLYLKSSRAYFLNCLTLASHM
jgi:hypothetical protein